MFFIYRFKTQRKWQVKLHAVTALPTTPDLQPTLSVIGKWRLASVDKKLFAMTFGKCRDTQQQGMLQAPFGRICENGNIAFAGILCFHTEGKIVNPDAGGHILCNIQSIF